MILSLCATHKKASVPILESLAFKDRQEAIRELRKMPFVEECALIQTCNRVEIHVEASDVSTKEAVNRLVESWSQNVKVSQDMIFNVIDVYEGREALQHLLYLAAGLESMVIGEDQILGQIRNACVEAKEVDGIKSVLDTVFAKALNVGRRVRVETGISRGSVSVSSVAVELAEKILGDLNGVKVLLIGAGEAATLAANELTRREVGNVLVANRTYERGIQLAKTIGGEAVRLEYVNDYIPKVDLVIVAASASVPLLTLDSMKGASNNEAEGQLLVVDISQPRCVEEAVGRLPWVNLKTIDDLKGIVEDNLKKRSCEAEKAREIIREELGLLEKLLKKIATEPTISGLCREVEKIRVRELSKALHAIHGISDDQRVVIENLTKELAERILQLPINNLREAALNDDNSLLSAANRLFSLKDEQELMSHGEKQ